MRGVEFWNEIVRTVFPLWLKYSATYTLPRKYLYCSQSNSFQIIYSSFQVSLVSSAYFKLQRSELLLTLLFVTKKISNLFVKFHNWEFMVVFKCFSTKLLLESFAREFCLFQTTKVAIIINFTVCYNNSEDVIEM